MKPRVHVVSLSPQQRADLHQMLSAGVASARTLTRARVLLKADAAQEGGAWPDARIAQALEVGLATVQRVRRRFAEGGMQAALHRKEQPNRRARVLDGRAEAFLIATACSAPPDGQKRWTLHLLRGRVIEAGHADAVSHETVRQALKKTNSSPGCGSTGASPRRGTPPS